MRPSFLLFISLCAIAAQAGTLNYTFAGQITGLTNQLKPQGAYPDLYPLFANGQVGDPIQEVSLS